VNRVLTTVALLIAFGALGACGRGEEAHIVDDAALAKPYTSGPKGVDVTGQRWLIHLAVHAGFHLGQAGYLRRVVTGNGATADTVSVKVLNEP